MSRLGTIYLDEKNVVSGTTFPGLGFNIVYFFKGDLSAQLSQLRERLGSERHQEFEEALEACE